MKRTARNILLIVVAVLLLTAFVGCKPTNSGASGPLQVNTIKIMPYAYMGEEFDLRDVLLMEEGVEYSATACYVDLDTMTEYTLEVNDLCFTPVAVRETVVVITAKRGTESAAKVIYIPTTIRAEPLDDLYKSSGALGGSDPGISKSVNIDPAFLYGDKSTTSLHVSFNSTDPHPYGNLFMSFAAEAAQEHFTDKTWENAIVTFWVYNPNELPIEFQLRIVDEEAGTNLDWQTVDGPHKQRAEAGQWTQIFFSLRKLGTTHRLTTGKYSTEMLSLKFRYDGYSTTDAYSFDFYMDNIDVVDASMYPEIDTKYVLSNETIEQGWENMRMDTGWQGVYTEYDYEFIQGEGSTCSLKAYFNSEKSLTNSFICLSPEAEFDTNPDMTGGTLSGYFKFDGLDPKVSVDILNKSWETSNKVDMKLQALSGGWYYGTLNLEDLQVGTGRNDEIIRIRLHFSGVSNKSVVYVDTLIYEYKHVEKVLESADVDLINMSLDTGSYYNNLTYAYVTSPIIGKNTVRSLKLVAPANTDGRFTWNTDTAADKGELSSMPNMSYGTLGAWFYFGKQLPNASFQVTSDNWKGSTALPFVFTKNNGDGWYYGELHGSDIKFVENANAKSVIRWTLIVPKGYTVYVDNLSWTTKYENTLTAAEIDPSVLYDGGDLLADTNSISYDKRHWENVDNTDDFDKDGKVDPDLTKGLTCGVDTKNIYGDYSVRSWYFKAAASNNYANAIAQLKLAKGYDMTGKNLAFDIKIDTESKAQQPIGLRLQTTGWSNINEQNVNIKVNPGAWKHVVVSFDDVIKDGADITALGFISFYFDFAATSGYDRVIYIDNVTLTTDAPTAEEAPLVKADNAENDWTNMSQDKGDYYCNVVSEIKTDKVKGEISTKSLYVKAPADVAGKLTFNTDYAVQKGELDKKPNMNAGILSAWFYFGDQQPSATLKITEAGWKGSAEVPFVFAGESENGWYFGTVDCATATYAETSAPGLAIRVTIGVPAGFDGYIDSMTFEPADVPDPVPPETTEPEVTEPVAEDLGDLLGACTDIVYNKDHWTEANGLSVTQDTENVYGDESVRSWKFCATADANMMQAVAQFHLDQMYDMTGKNLAFDIKISVDSKIQQSVGVRLHNKNWSNLNDHNKVVKLNPGEWKTVVMNFDDVLNANADYTDISLLSFYFDFAANTGKERAIYIDNVRLTTDAPTADDEALPLGPEDLDDGGDLLANAYPANGDTNGIFNGASYYSYDAQSDKLFKENAMGKYSVKSWKFTSTMTEANYPTALIDLGSSVNMNGKALAMDVFFENTKGTVAIYTLHNSGWSKLNASENAANYIANGKENQWNTLYFDISKYLADGKDLSDVRFIKFQFFFDASDGTSERSVYFDNLRFVDPGDIPVADDPEHDWTNMKQDTGDYYCTVESEIKTDNVKGKFSTQSLYVKAPANADGKLTLNTDYAVTTGQIDALPELYNGTLGAWFYFGENTPSAKLTVTEAGWKGSVQQEFVFGENENGWYYGIVEGTEISFSETKTPGLPIRITITLPAGFEGYIDSMTLTDAETVNEDWIKMRRDSGITNVEFSFDRTVVKAENSLQSLCIKTPADQRGILSLHTESAFGTNFDMTSGTLSAWFYFGSEAPEAYLMLNGNNKSSNEAAFTFDAGDEGWYFGTVDLRNITYAEAGGTSSNTLRLNIILPKAMGIYIDGLTYKTLVETSEDDLINLSHNNGTLSTDVVYSNTSRHSLYVDASSSAVTVTFTPESALNFADGKITAWFNFGGSEPPDNVRFVAFKTNTQKTGYLTVAFGTESVNGWYKGTVEIPDDKQSIALSVLKFTVQIPKGSKAYIDDLQFEPDDSQS